MGSGYYGEPNLGNERGVSSRKGKKISSDKPKQPQRGLGVAQLEKIRLHGQIGVNYIPYVHNPYPPNFNQMGLGDYERTDIRNGDSQTSTAASWIPRNNSLEAQHYGHANTTRHFLNLKVEDTQPKKNKKHRSNSMSSNSENSESSHTEIDRR